MRVTGLACLVFTVGTVMISSVSSHSRPHHAARPAPAGDAPPPGSHMSTHGMLVFGENYFSHIPMFHEPHDYQIIMDVKLQHPQLEEGRNFGGELHTFVPDKFSLGDLLNGKLKTIEGTLFRGNFEKEGAEPLLEDVKAEVKTILHSKHLSEGSQGSAELEYVLYGSKQDAYLIHPIEGNAGFDQLVSVDASSVQATDEEIARGVLVKVPGRPNVVESRLTSGTFDAVEVGDGDALQIKVKKELSVLVGPHFMDGPAAGGGHGHH